MVHSWRRRATKYFGEVWVPMAEIWLRRTDGAYQPLAIQIDSGAVVSLLRRSAASYLGLELKAGRLVELSSVGGVPTRAYVHEIATRFDAGHDLSVPYAIAEDETVPNLLGRIGIFDTIQIDFDASLLETRLTPKWLDDKGREVWNYLLETGKHLETRWDQMGLSAHARQATIQLYNRASRVVAATAGLTKLHRAWDTPILIRALFEVAAQFEYLMRDAEKRGLQFLDYAHVTRYQQAMDFVRNPQGWVTRSVANSPLRAEGEKRLKAEFDRVRSQFTRPDGRLWRNWYGKSVRDLCEEIGWQDEYRIWYRSFSNWVHSDPSSLAESPPWRGSVALFQCYHYYARMLLRIADSGNVLLTSDQYQALQRLAQEFA